jgi:hypothetical protein
MGLLSQEFFELPITRRGGEHPDVFPTRYRNLLDRYMNVEVAIQCNLGIVSSVPSIDPETHELALVFQRISAERLDEGNRMGRGAYESPVTFDAATPTTAQALGHDSSLTTSISEVRERLSDIADVLDSRP